MKFANLFFVSALFSKISAASSYLDENLSIYKLQNNWAMLEFNYEFTMADENDAQSDESHLGVYPAQFESVFASNPNFDWFEFSLVQGRWNENFIK